MNKIFNSTYTNKCRCFIMKKKFKEYLLITIGCVIAAAGTALFLLPNKLSSGGFSGIATIFYYFLEIPMGTTIILLNIPLFIISYFKIGKNFLIKSIYATVLYSEIIDLFSKMNTFTEDRFLDSIYGGVLIGIGLSLVFKGRASTGGTDLIVQIIKSFSKRVVLSNALVIMDGIVVILNLIFFKQIEIGLYSVISIIIIGKMIDLVAEGINFSKMLYIVSDKSKEIAEKVNLDIDSGATGLYGKGMYTSEEKMILMCVTKRRNVITIKNLALEIDPNAFIIITDAREVYGLGFKK